MQYEVVGKKKYSQKVLMCTKHRCVPSGAKLNWCMVQGKNGTYCPKLVWICQIEAEVVGGKNE